MERKCRFCGFHGPEAAELQCLVNEMTALAYRILWQNVDMKDASRQLLLLAKEARASADDVK
jgi:hypothetical protein